MTNLTTQITALKKRRNEYLKQSKEWRNDYKKTGLETCAELHKEYYFKAQGIDEAIKPPFQV